MKDEKYMVFKRSEMEAWAYDPDAPSFSNAPKALEDARVIRTQDIFAPAGLWAYANNIHTWCEIEAKDLEGIPRHQARERFDRLDRAREIADYFAECAYEAEARDDSKFPD